ncbi:ESPR-type extended signal peptide-containing protein [Acidaminococcus fermentans]|uniref:ESPR-type extended signal peptide-containing protein n=1 Tax=Acidaminococcus fermentans TaxID=905 RepID=UPI00242B3271|nr:ESPR-type extended signal peptide-containing protein [Acidaminococcus fermentans]MCI6286240.1 YadA-like family protein [Acidaminococcus fermentans]
MNKIYKVIWNKTRGMYMVVSELAKGQSKDGRRAVGRKKVAQTAAALAVFFSIVSMGGTSFAADTGITKVESSTSDTAVEVYTKAGTDSQIDAAKKYTYRKAAELNTRITNVKEYLEKQTSENYVSKTDAAVQDAGVVKANKKIGENVTALGKGLYDETAARIGADAAQDKVIQAVNDNLVQSVTTINKNVADGFNALNTADANEAAAREAGDTALDTRITNVKKYLEGQTADTYVSKTDATVQDGAIVKAANTIGENVTNLDAALTKETAARIGADKAQDAVIQQVNQNAANGIATLATAYNNEVASREAADNELNERITNEAKAIHETTNRLQDDLNTETAAREAGDTALNTRITNVKEYLEQQTSDKYVSKADAAVQDGAIVKANKTIGENVTNLDAALASETAARIGADKAQDKVIQTVNDNLVQSVNTINQNMSAGFNALSQADANELAGRVAADTELAKAVNNGLSLDQDNVLQKNTTSVGEDGTVTTSKEAATTLVMNKDGNNQITLSENGIKVGQNSTVQDANGFYAGGDNAEAAKAALNADGSIKGADGAFDVDTSGNVTSGNVTSTGTVQGTTLTDGKGASMSNGVVTGKTLTDGTASLSNGNLTGAHNITADGTITGATLTDGKATISNGNIKTNGGFIQTGGGNVNTQGGEVRTNGGKVATSGGEINTGSGAIKTVGGDILTAGGKLNTSGGDIAAGTGNISGQNITASGVLSGDSLTVAKGMTGHSLTLTGGDLDAGAGTIKTTGKVQAGTLETTGDATIGGDLDVKGDLSVEGKFNANTLSSKLDENNYTEIHGGNVTSVNSKVDTTDGKTYTSTATLTEKGKTETASNGINRNVEKMDATESSDVISNDANGQTSTFRQKIDQILQEIKTSDEIYSKIDQTVNQMNSTVRDGANSTSVEQGTQDITHTAEQGTISNIAKDLVNTAAENMTNTIGKDLTTTVGGNETRTVKGTLNETVIGNVTEDYKANLDTKVGGNETRTVEGTLTETVTGDVTEDYKANLSTTVGGSQTTTVTGDSSLKAENITNEAKNKITNKAIDVETDATSSIVQKVTNDAGSNTSTQLSYQTKEEMSQADGKTASYLRGAAEEKSQLIDGDKKTTIDTIAGQTNTNITDGTNTSNSLQKADQVASSVTDGTNTTVVNQDAKSIASSITDGTKANSTNSTVDKSEQLIKASDTQYSATSKTATKMEDALVSGGSVIDVIKNLDDAANPFISSAVTDGTNITGVTQTAKDITNTAKNGTITNEAKDITNNATENMTNTVGKDLSTTVGGEMKTTVTGKTMENYNGGLETTITGEEKHTVNGSQINNVTGDQTNTIGGNQTTTVTGDSSLSAQNITNTAAKIENTASKSITDKVGDNVSRTMTTSQIKESVVDGANSNTSTKTASKDMNIVTDGTSTSTLSQLAGSVNTSLKEVDSSGNSVKSLNNVQTVSEDITKITDTASGDFSSRSQKANGFTSLVKNNSGGSNTVTDTASTSEQRLVSGNIIDILKDSENGYVNTTVSNSDGSSSTGVKQTYTDITSTAEQGTITNEAKDLVNKAAENITNTAGNRIQDKVGTTTVTTTDGLTKLTNEAGNHKTQMDYAEVLKDLGVKGNATIDKDLSVGGSAAVAGNVTAKSYKVGDKTYIDENGINANGQKVTNVADGTIAEGSKDAVNGGQLHATNQRVSTVENRMDGVENRVDRVENRVDNLDNRIDKVGASAAAMANLHPMDFDEDSKVSVAAAVGNYRSETAGALGVFYRPTDRVMMNVSTSFGNGENMIGGGVSFKLGKSSKRLEKAEATNAALVKQVTNLQNRLDALLGVLNPNLSKAFPDVPANHWAYEAVSRLAGNDIIQGYEDGKYHGERTMTRYEMAEIIYNALSKGAKAEAKLVEEFRPELQAMAAQRKA